MWSTLRAILFRVDAERAHRWVMAAFSATLRLWPLRAALRRVCAPPSPELETRVAGLRVASPVGLAAGFDKDARWIGPLAALGFGFIEVGTLTAVGQPGNPLPRLFRLPKDRALLNRFGFNNSGSGAAQARLARRPTDVPVGVNIGKSKVTPNDAAAGDYLASLDRVIGSADYVTINVSSPNTAGLRDLQAAGALRALLEVLVAQTRSRAGEAGSLPVPLFVKIAPDLSPAEVDEIVDLAIDVGVAGIVATNTTISRDGLQTDAATVSALGAGGISGAPLTQRSREIVAAIRRRAGGRLTIIGVGGVMDADDAWELLRAGADALQVYTGFVYGGPLFVRRLNAGLRRRLRTAGRAHIAEIIGEGAAAGAVTPSR